MSFQPAVTVSSHISLFLWLQIVKGFLSPVLSIFMSLVSLTLNSAYPWFCYSQPLISFSPHFSTSLSLLILKVIAFSMRRDLKNCLVPIHCTHEKTIFVTFSRSDIQHRQLDLDPNLVFQSSAFPSDHPIIQSLILCFRTPLLQHQNSCKTSISCITLTNFPNCS